MLKADWQSGKIVFPNGNSVQLPCKVSEFIDTSYFVNKNIEVPIYENGMLYGKQTENI